MLPCWRAKWRRQAPRSCPAAITGSCERLNATADPADELDVLVDLLSQDLADWPDDAWIVIDDYHYLNESATAEAFVEGIVAAVARAGSDRNARTA